MGTRPVHMRRWHVREVGEKEAADWLHELRNSSSTKAPRIFRCYHGVVASKVATQGYLGAEVPERIVALAILCARSRIMSFQVATQEQVTRYIRDLNLLKWSP